MGVRTLNKYLLANCTIKKKHLSTFKDTVFAVDTSIYMYKFLGNFQDGDQRLETGFHQMCQMFIKYGIKPIFVFDGKPPTEKKQVILERTADKLRAETEYNQLVQKQSTSEQLNALRRRFIRIKDAEIQSVKDIISGYGIEYQEAVGEADTLCAQLIRSNRAFGCLSNDMDMFAYGCPHIMRELDMERSTVMYYNMRVILRELDISAKLFREAIILSGTDYNSENETPLAESMWLAREYQEYVKYIQKMAYNRNNLTLGCYAWLEKNTRYIKDYDKLVRIYSIFRNS